MTGFMTKWVLSFFVKELATGVGSVDQAAFTAKINTEIAVKLPTGLLAKTATDAVDAVISAIFKMAQDQTTILAVLTALSGQNVSAAEAALKTLVVPYLPADLAAAL
jgi:hypothetical protein